MNVRSSRRVGFQITVIKSLSARVQFSAAFSTTSGCAIYYLLYFMCVFYFKRVNRHDNSTQRMTFCR
jgi:hypothetical protein